MKPPRKNPPIWQSPASDSTESNYNTKKRGRGFLLESERMLRFFPRPPQVPERAPPPQWIWSLWYPLFPSFQAARLRHLFPIRLHLGQLPRIRKPRRRCQSEMEIRQRLQSEAQKSGANTTFAIPTCQTFHPKDHGQKH